MNATMPNGRDHEGDRQEAPLVRVEHLTKQFPVRGSTGVVSAVSDVSFELRPGETLGLVGESGSGKTTVGRCLLKLIPPTSGRIFYRGEDITDLSDAEFRPYRRYLQSVFQDPYDSLNPRYTAFDTIAEPIRLLGERDKTRLRARVAELAERVRLESRKLDAYPHQMSSGEQQRVGIARALSVNPSLVVLDEPTSMLDQSVRAGIIDLLVELQEELQLAYLFISHDLTTVEYLSHRVAVMYLGQIVEFGTARQIFTNPQHPYSRALLSSALPADPRIRRTSYLLQGEIPSAVDLPRGCYLASRCPEVKPECQVQPQVLTDIGDGHLVRCWRVASGDIPGWREAGERLTAVVR